MRLTAFVSTPAALVAVLFCLFAPQLAQATPTPTVTELTVTNSLGHHVTQVNYTSAPPANLINLNAIVRNIGTVVTVGNVEFCEVEGTHCRAIGTVPVTPLIALLNVGATITIAPTFGTHTYRAVYVGTDSTIGSCASGCGSSTSNSVTIKVVGPPPPAATSTTLNSSGTPGNYTLNAAISGVGAGNGWGAGFDLPITGQVNFLDTTNANFNFGPAAVGPTTFSSGFVAPALNLPPQPPAFSVTLGAVANAKTGIDNAIAGPLYNDGSPDLIFVVPNLNPPGGYVIETFFNQLMNGAQSFSPVGPVLNPILATTANPLAMVVGDFYNEEHADVVISFDDGSIYLFRGNGFGNFATPVTLQPSGGPLVTSMYVSDLEHSGYQSVFGVSPIGVVLFQNGPLGIESGGDYLGIDNLSWDWTASIAAGNFTDLTDDHTELVVTNPDSQSITVIIGNGLGAFGLLANYPVGNGPSAIAVADFNGDGHLDLAIVNSTDNTVTILLGAGDGTFTLAATLPVGNDPLYIATGDFNGDGVVDLAVGNQGDGTITVLLGVGDGSFTLSPSSPLLSTSNGDWLGGVLAADFNTDHFTDIAAVNSLFPDIFIAQLNAATTASLTGVSVVGSSGTHQVDAAYSGDTHYQPSTSGTVGLTAQPLLTALHLAVLPASPSQWGQQLTLTATLNPYSAQGKTTNGEFVTFYDGFSSLGTRTLLNGVATLNLSSPSVGTHNLRATYPGDTNFLASNSSVVPFTVDQAPSTTLLSAATHTPQVGVADLLTATVTGFSAPRGLVEFEERNTVICSVPLGANGKATCSWVPWTTNPAFLVAVYEGDPDYLGSTSPVLHLTATDIFDRQVVLTIDDTHLTYPGQAQTKTCVSPRGTRTPTGSVEIFDDFTSLQTLPLGGDGCAIWYIDPGLHAGTQYLRAHYSGDSRNPAGYSEIVAVTVSQLPTYWSVQCPQNIQRGQNEQCSVHIWSNLGPPQGIITYSYDGGPAQSLFIGGGQVSFLIPDPKVGHHTIVVAYPGSQDFAPIPAQTENFTVSH